MLIIIN